MDDRIVTDPEGISLFIYAEDAADNYETRMIMNNKPEGLIPLDIREEAGKKVLHYRVKGLLPLKTLPERSQTELLYNVIFALERLESVLSSYMLSEDRILLEPETVFLDPENKKVRFCYDPGKEASFRASFQRLMEWFIRNMKPAEEEDVLTVYRIYQKSREDDLTLKDPAMIWREEKLKKKELPAEMKTYSPGGSYQASQAFEIREETDESTRILMDIGIRPMQKESGFDLWRKRNVFEESYDDRQWQETKKDISYPEEEAFGKKEEYLRKIPDHLREAVKENRLESAALVIMILVVIFLLIR